MQIPDINPLLFGKYFILIDKIVIKGNPQKNPANEQNIENNTKDF